jgi:predicted Zn-dependent protease
LPDAEAAIWRDFWAEVDRLSERNPTRRLTEAREHVRHRRWAKASAAYLWVIDASRTDNGEIWFEYAAAQRLAGDREGYRRTCEQMEEMVAKTPKMRRYLLARASTLTSETIAVAARTQDEIEEELVRFGSNSWSLTEQGALACRAGRHKEAIELFERSLRSDTRSGAAALNRLWLAIAFARKGDPTEAKRRLSLGAAQLDSIGKELPANAEASIGVHLHDWLEAHVLRREAEDLLAANSEK